jgi:hypothetical protein
MEDAPSENIGVPTVGVTVTVWIAVAGPLHPAALAVITEVPLQRAAKVTTPVPATIVLPPVRLAASSEYVIPVELVAVAP